MGWADVSCNGIGCCLVVDWDAAFVIGWVAVLYRDGLLHCHGMSCNGMGCMPTLEWVAVVSWDGTLSCHGMGCCLVMGWAAVL